MCEHHWRRVVVAALLVLTLAGSPARASWWDEFWEHVKDVLDADVPSPSDALGGDYWRTAVEGILADYQAEPSTLGTARLLHMVVLIDKDNYDGAAALFSGLDRDPLAQMLVAKLTLQNPKTTDADRGIAIGRLATAAQDVRSDRLAASGLIDAAFRQAARRGMEALARQHLADAHERLRRASAVAQARVQEAQDRDPDADLPREVQLDVFATSLIWADANRAWALVGTRIADAPTARRQFGEAGKEASALLGILTTKRVADNVKEYAGWYQAVLGVTQSNVWAGKYRYPRVAEDDLASYASTVEGRIKELPPTLPRDELRQELQWQLPQTLRPDQPRGSRQWPP